MVREDDRQREIPGLKQPLGQFDPGPAPVLPARVRISVHIKYLYMIGTFRQRFMFISPTARKRVSKPRLSVRSARGSRRACACSCRLASRASYMIGLSRTLVDYERSLAGVDIMHVIDGSPGQRR